MLISLIAALAVQAPPPATASAWERAGYETANFIGYSGACSHNYTPKARLVVFEVLERIKGMHPTSPKMVDDIFMKGLRRAYPPSAAAQQECSTILTDLTAKVDKLIDEALAETGAAEAAPEASKP
jgi:hypothetical protein